MTDRHRDCSWKGKLHISVPLIGLFAAFWTLSCSFCYGLHKLSSRSWPLFFRCSVTLSAVGSFSPANLTHQDVPFSSLSFLVLFTSQSVLLDEPQTPNRPHCTMQNYLTFSLFPFSIFQIKFLEPNFSWPNDLLKCFVKQTKKKTAFPQRNSTTSF